MRLWKTLPEWQEQRRRLAGKRIGFVPTMGALHRGHGSLVERCRRENDIVVVSIFVNPSQFNEPKDLERYPRTLDQDLALLRQLETDEVLLPSAKELYPNGYQLRLEPSAEFTVMEGKFRPGFLQGVLTIVLKLFHLVLPDRAYFGEKDYQQLKAIADMVQELFLPIEVVACETVREESGLAQSSRNMLLSAEARTQAAALFRSLTTCASATEARADLEKQGFAVEYVEEHWGRRFVAAFLEGVRLIDNVAIPALGSETI